MKKFFTVLLIALFTMPLAALAAEVKIAGKTRMATAEKSSSSATTLVQNKRRMRRMRQRVRTRTRMRTRMRVERRIERRHHRRRHS